MPKPVFLPVKSHARNNNTNSFPQKFLRIKSLLTHKSLIDSIRVSLNLLKNIPLPVNLKKIHKVRIKMCTGQKKLLPARKNFLIQQSRVHLRRKRKIRQKNIAGKKSGINKFILNQQRLISFYIITQRRNSLSRNLPQSVLRKKIITHKNKIILP